MAVLFTLGTLVVGALFVYEIEHRHQIRSGLLTYAAFTGATAYGMWRMRRWGRALALVVALGNAGLGTLVLLSALATHQGSKFLPATLLGTNIVLGYLLGLRVFTLPDEH